MTMAQAYAAAVADEPHGSRGTCAWHPPAEVYCGFRSMSRSGGRISIMQTILSILHLEERGKDPEMVAWSGRLGGLMKLLSQGSREDLGEL